MWIATSIACQYACQYACPVVKKSIDIHKGLLPKSRLYVHLSKDFDTAVKVGARHGKPVVYRIAAQKMAEDGYKFYLSVNGVWLTKEVPIKYLTK